jgi:MFS family permease
MSSRAIDRAVSTAPMRTGLPIVRRLGPVATVRAGSALATLGGVVLVWGRTPGLSIAGFALLGVGVAVIVPLVFAAAGHAGRTPGEGAAGVATITYLAGLVAPAVTGWVAGITSFPTAFGLITCATLAMGCIAGVLRPRPTPSPDREHEVVA